MFLVKQHDLSGQESWLFSKEIIRLLEKAGKTNFQHAKGYHVAINKQVNTCSQFLLKIGQDRTGFSFTVKVTFLIMRVSRP